MRNPYEVLHVLTSASDSEIKEAYLKMIKKYPPDKFSEEFKEVRDAYEKVSTIKARIGHRLFDLEELDVSALLKRLRMGEQRNRILPKRIVEVVLEQQC
ncbi:MAG: J domain-containing protein [bacterium]